MARTIQYPQNFIPLLTEARFARSRELHIAAGNVWPGDLLNSIGNLAGVPGEIRWIALQPTPAAPTNITVLSRDCEITDSYLRYRGLNRNQVHQALAAYNIVVRQGVLPDADAYGRGTEPGSAPENYAVLAAQVPAPLAQGDVPDLTATLARGWAVLFHWRSYFVGAALRWGRRR